MNPTDRNKMDKQNELGSEMGKIQKFKNKFRDPNNKNRLREGLWIEDIFQDEDVGYKSMKWQDLSPQIRDWIQSKRNEGAYGVSMRPWEGELGQFIFGKPEKGSYYLLRRMGKDYAWSRFWLDGETPHFEPLNHDSSLSEIIDTVAYHEFDELAKPKQRGQKVVEETRANLRPWEALRKWR